MLQDDAQTTWLYTTCGLVRLEQSELDAWAAAVDQRRDGAQSIHATVFDSSDGVRSLEDNGGYTPHAVKSSDGRLWFLPSDGASVIDPQHLPTNGLIPPVHIEKITANRKQYEVRSGQAGSLQLPALIRNLEIDYTALSLAAPEKVRFRYRLDDHDHEWQDVGTRRQAFYTDLSPGTYRFHVTACNNSGVWNEAGTFVDFAIAPAYYQTMLFRLLCASVFVAGLWALYRLRVRRFARQFSIRLEERVSERTRIARELHDTLLQSFQGVLMKFSVFSLKLTKQPELYRQLEAIVTQARQAVIEGRDAVHGLRSSTMCTNEMAQDIRSFGEALTAEPSSSLNGATRPGFRVSVDGEARDLAPIVRDEVYRIACEAVRNAYRHGQAARIEAAIHYGGRHFRLRVVDDGKGIDPKILSEGGREGHQGLPGMNERAKLAGGKLVIHSKSGSGTEIEVNIPAALAYLA